MTAIDSTHQDGEDEERIKEDCVCVCVCVCVCGGVEKEKLMFYSVSNMKSSGERTELHMCIVFGI